MTEPTWAQDLFKGRHFDQEIIVLCIRWYLTFKLSSRDLVQMMAERGIALQEERGNPPKTFATRTNSGAALERITSAGNRIVVSRTEPLTHREDLNVPAHGKTCLKQLSELTSLSLP